MRLTCLVDNVVRPHSRFWGEHGLAFLVESEDGRLLFDTGTSGTVLLHNLEVAEVSLTGISALVLSHAHRDHTGGLLAVLERPRSLPIYAHPDLMQERFSRRGGQVRPIGLTLDAETLRQQADLHLSAVPQEILPGIWTTGEIRQRPEPEGRSPYHFVRDGEDWLPDPYRDDMALVLDRPHGLVLVCGCCHAGLLNTLLYVERTFQRPVVAITGGTHLIEATAEHLQRVEQVLLEMESVRHIYLNHCSGEAAIFSLLLRLGPQVVHSCPAGTWLDLEVLL
jgi:7,8-dihydropterin-6-yl-methyl-4-(beta-D-ribofuranosyl)aminobenzene 5'-phosphate synthase